MVLNELFENDGLIDTLSSYKVTSELKLPEDFSNRLTKLRELDPDTHADRRFNKTSKYVIFGKDELDIKSDEEVLVILKKQWSHEDVCWLFKILGYDKHVYEYGLVGLKVIEYA